MAHLGLGSNLGDRAGTLAAAVAAIARRPGIAAIRCSSLYETEPQGLREQPWFLNCVLAVATTLDPAQLLAACQAVEADFGRVRDVRWGPRTLDVDILLYGERVLQTPDLTLPHPRLHERAFALLPLAEVAPTALVPGHGSVAGLLAAVAGQAVRRVGEPPPLPVGSSAPRGRPPRRAGRPAGEGAP